MEVWYPAAVELGGAGIDGIAALVNVLADASATDAHRAAVRALVAQGEAVVAPLVAYANRGDAALNEKLVQVLAELPRPTARPVLLTIAFAQSSSESSRESALLALRRLGERDLSVNYALVELIKLSGEHLDRKRSFDLEGVENVEMWRWDAELNRPKLASVSFDESSAILAGLRAQQALAIVPDSVEAAELLLTAALETSVLLGASEQQRAGIDQLAEQLGADVVEASLVKALATRRVDAAVAAIRLLARTGDGDLLNRSAPSISPLAKATMDADREVRLAALEAVVELAPEGGFAGASFVPAGLTYFTRGLGARQAIVADPRPGEALRLATLLGGLGYDVEIANKLDELSRLAAEHPDCELILVAVIPASRFTPSALDRLRRDHRTADLPVALITAAIDLRQAEALAQGDRLAEVMIRPVDHAGLESQLASVGRPLTAGVVPAEVRRQQTARALKLLAQIADVSAGGYQLTGIDEAVDLACYDAGLNAAACAVLAKVNSPGAQRQLVDLASNDALPIELRQAAGEGFRDSVARRGILLTSEQMLVQYARYNESQRKGQATQRLLGSILDCLEGVNKTALNRTP
jgi:CheY-like chemotaxis protein